MHQTGNIFWGGYGAAMFLRVPRNEVARRLPQVVLGLVLFGVGVAMMKASELGLGPWNVFHEGIAERTSLSLGQVIIVVGVLVTVLFIPLREQIGIGTVLNALIIGNTVDVALWLVDEPSAIAARIALMVAGPVVIGLGSGLYIGGGLGPGPRDGVMTGLAKRGIQIWRARTGIEITVLVLGLLLGGTAGVGTVWFAFGIGPLVQRFLPRFTLPPPRFA